MSVKAEPPLKVLLICNDFPPLNSIGAQRPYSWFHYFNQFGVDCQVVTKGWIGPSSTPVALIQNLPKQNEKHETLPEGTITRVKHHVLKNEKLIIKGGKEYKPGLRKLYTLCNRLLSFPFLFADGHKNLYLTAKKILSKNQFDCIITTGEPFILHKYGAKLSHQFKINWIADYRDGWYNNHTSIQNNGMVEALLKRYEFYFEKKYLKNARLITSVDPSLTKSLQELHQKEAFCVYNGYWKTLSEKQRTSTGPVVFTHTGTLTGGQQAEFFLQAISELLSSKTIGPEDVKINFVGLTYSEEQKQRIENFSTALQPVLNLTNRIPHEEAMEINLESDFLLSFTDKHFNALYTKTYDYIACGKPVLVLPNDHGLLEQLIVKNNLGQTFEQIDELKTFVLEQVKDKKAGKTLSISSDPQATAHFSRKEQAKRFAEKIRSI